MLVFHHFTPAQTIQGENAIHRREVISNPLRSRFVFLPLLIVFCITVSSVHAGKFNRKVSVGDKAPDWKNLEGVDEKEHSLVEYRSKLVVVVFIANHCPVTAAYEERLKQLRSDYDESDVSLIAVSISQYPSDRLEKMIERSQDSGFKFPYLHDPTQSIGRDYGVTMTPQVFLLDRERKIAYMGAIDNQKRSDKPVEQRYLRVAIDALLAGNSYEIKETRPFGCEIEYEDVTNR